MLILTLERGYQKPPNKAFTRVIGITAPPAGSFPGFGVFPFRQRVHAPTHLPLTRAVTCRTAVLPSGAEECFPKGETVSMKLYLMQLALFQPIAAPVPGYVIQTDDGINILVDTGLPYSTIGNLQGPPGLQLEMKDADYIVNQLANIGLRPTDIQFLVCTHFDPDHAGNHDVFTSSELIVQRQHYVLARAGYPRFGIVRDHWDHP